MVAVLRQAWIEMSRVHGSVGRILAMTLMELTLARREAYPFVILLALPMILMPLVTVSLRHVSTGSAHPVGAAQVVPALATHFAIYSMTFVGYPVFRDHYWKTWDRVRAAGTTGVEVLLAKTALLFARSCVQQGALLALGIAMLDVSMAGPVAGLAAVALSLSAFVVASGMALASLCSSFERFNAIGFLLEIVLVGLSGTLLPLDAFPGWLQALVAVSPGFWAYTGYRAALAGGQAGTVLSQCGALLLLSATLVAVSAWAFREREATVTS